MIIQSNATQEDEEYYDEEEYYQEAEPINDYQDSQNLIINMRGMSAVQPIEEATARKE